MADSLTRTWNPSDELRDELVEEGWIQIDGAIDVGSLDRVGEWLAEISKDPRRLLLVQAERDPSGVLRKFRRLYWADPEFWARWIVESGLRDVVRFVIRQNPCLMKQAAFLKSPEGGSAVGYHQDQALWETEINTAYSFWVPLDAADETNGGLVMFSGSHRDGRRPHDPDPAHPWHGVVDVTQPGFRHDTVVIEPGGVVVHDRYIVHGSPPNTSGQLRRAVVFTFASEPPEEVRPQLRETYVPLTELEALAGA